MPRTIICSCGQQFKSRDDEELYSLMRQHVDPLHPEEHRSVAVQGRRAIPVRRPRTRRIERRLLAGAAR
jgi:hypothetical protein